MSNAERGVPLSHEELAAERRASLERRAKRSKGELRSYYTKREERGPIERALRYHVPSSSDRRKIFEDGYNERGISHG